MTRGRGRGEYIFQCYDSTHCDTAQIWSWRTQYTSPAHNKYPAIYVVFVCRGEKWQSAFKK